MFGNDYKEILTYLLININHLQEFINDIHPVTINDVINNILEKTTSYHLLDKKLKKKEAREIRNNGGRIRGIGKVNTYGV